jgi:hypothetical protein
MTESALTAPANAVQPAAAVFTLLLLQALPTSAAEPLYVKNLSPVAGLFGLPSQRSADTPGAGEFLLAVHGSLANTYVNEFRRPEAVNLDGEVGRVALELRYGIGEDWDLSIEVPWLQHSGGHLDSLIDGWHDLFGMSDGGRDAVDRDLLDYRYAGPDTAFELTDDASGVGDISVALNRVFYRRDATRVSAVAGYKFSSGDAGDFTGSGSEDAYLALRFSGAHLSGLPLTWHGQLGYLRAGEADALGELQNRDLWFVGLALDWAAWEHVSLLAQLDGHAGPTDSSLTGIGEDAWMLSLGLRWQLAPRWQLDFSFVEDIQIETAPDIIFQTSLRYHPG